MVSYLGSIGSTNISSSLIYDASWGKTSGTTWVEWGEGDRWAGGHSHSVSRFLKFLGKGLILISLAGIMLTYLPVVALETQSEKRKMQNIEERELVEVWLTEQEQFGIEISSLGLREKVIPNVDLGNKDSYMTALKEGVAHGAGSGFPGTESQVNRTIYLFAHSTDFDWNVSRYNALFYRLKDLEKDNEIKLTFWGEEYRYRVEEVKKLAAEETSFLKPQIEEEKLVLSTCWPPGTTWKRLVVVAKRVEND